MIVIRKINSGAVSLFVVIFATLLITVVTVSFVRIMVQGQRQASSTDLSQSAYDSAQVGVEDAKRALLRYQSICNTGTPVECAAAKAQINSSICNASVETLTDISALNGEIKVQTGNIANNLNQAYTCVKIIMDTPDYLDSLDADASKLIPLVGENPFNSVKIEWFDSKNLSSVGNFNVDVLASSLGTPLLAQLSWPSNRPPIMRAQLILASSGFLLSGFDSEDSTNTLFLYPSNPGSGNLAFSQDNHKFTSNVPIQVGCSTSLSAVRYACSVTLALASPISGSNNSAFLKLSTIYNKANYRVSLLNGDTVVRFDSVQPEVDSTGRADNLFRRVKSRIEMGGVFPYPQAELDISGNLCKNIFVTDQSTDYDKYKLTNNCTP